MLMFIVCFCIFLGDHKNNSLVSRSSAVSSPNQLHSHSRNFPFVLRLLCLPSPCDTTSDRKWSVLMDGVWKLNNKAKRENRKNVYDKTPEKIQTLLPRTPLDAHIHDSRHNHMFRCLSKIYIYRKFRTNLKSLYGLQSKLCVRGIKLIQRCLPTDTRQLY